MRRQTLSPVTLTELIEFQGFKCACCQCELCQSSCQVFIEDGQRKGICQGCFVYWEEHNSWESFRVFVRGERSRRKKERANWKKKL